MKKFSFIAIERMAHATGAKRISPDAVKLISEELEGKLSEIVKYATWHASQKGRRTVRKEDIEAYYGKAS